MTQPKIINPVGTGVPSGVGAKAGQLFIRKSLINDIVEIYVVTADEVVKPLSDIYLVEINNEAITYHKIQNVSATDKILGRFSAGAGTIEEITCTSFGRSLIDDPDASTARTTLGLGSLSTQSGTFSGTSSGTNTGDQNLFSTIAVAGQNSIIADTTSDTLTIIAGANIVLTTNATNDELTISASGGSFSLSSDLTPTLGGNLNVSSYSIVDSNSNEFLTFNSIANAVNRFTIANNSTGNSPKLSVTGNDTNIGLTIEAKGSGNIVINSPVRLEKILGLKVIDLGADTVIDVSAGGGIFKKSVSTNTTLTITGVNSLINGYEYDFRLNITWTAGTLTLPSGTYINNTSAPSSFGIYSLIYLTDDAGSTWRIGGV